MKMTVGRLISELDKYSKDLEVYVNTYRGLKSSEFTVEKQSSKCRYGSNEAIIYHVYLNCNPDCINNMSNK